jgi:hypothetical protein
MLLFLTCKQHHVFTPDTSRYMLLLLHFCLQEEDRGPDLDCEHIMERSAAAGTAGDLLQLTLNCTNHWAASGAIIAAGGLEAGVLCRMMLTAALRQHAEALFLLARWKVCKQQADVPTLEKLLHLVLHWLDCASGCAAVQCHVTLRSICKMPAAAQLSSEQVATLLHKAVQRDDGFCLELFLSLPAAEQLSSVCMEQLLCLSVVCAKVRSECVFVLCSDSPARELSCEAVARLLLAAAQQEGLFKGVGYNLLCGLPGAAHLTSSMIAAAMQAAVEEGNSGCLQLLCELTAAELTSADVQVMLHAAVKRNHQDSVMFQARLPVAQQLTSAEVLALLQVAVTQYYSRCTQHLCQLPGARMLSKEAIEPLVQAAVKMGQHDGARQLCGLPAGSGLNLGQGWLFL